MQTNSIRIEININDHLFGYGFTLPEVTGTVKESDVNDGWLSNAIKEAIGTRFGKLVEDITVLQVAPIEEVRKQKRRG